jgi:hypothetical protein
MHLTHRETTSLLESWRRIRNEIDATVYCFHGSRRTNARVVDVKGNSIVLQTEQEMLEIDLTGARFSGELHSSVGRYEAYVVGKYQNQDWFALYAPAKKGQKSLMSSPHSFISAPESRLNTAS